MKPCLTLYMSYLVKVYETLVNRALKSMALATLATLWCAAPLWADDTEIFFARADSAATRPNVLFIIDTSNSMNRPVAGGRDRLDEVKAAFFELLDELDNVNVGLMRFTNPGGPILYPVSFIDDDENAGVVVTTRAAVAAGSDDAQERKATGQMLIDSERLELLELSGPGLRTFTDRVNSAQDDAEERIGSGRVSLTGDVLDLGADRRVGLRFSGSDIPRGATITRAYLRFTAANDGNPQPLHLQISAEAADSGPFQSTPYHLRERASTRVRVDWRIDRELLTGASIDTPDIATIVQEIVDDPGWNPRGGEDDMVFILQSAAADNRGERNFVSRDASAVHMPKLVVEYYPGTPSPASRSLAGIRFDKVDLPRGAKVVDAYIEFRARRDFSSALDMHIAIEDSGDAAAFAASAHKLSQRSTLSAAVPWTGVLTQRSGDAIRTPSLTDLVQSVSSRATWCGGNALSFIFDSRAAAGAAGALPLWSYEGDPSRAPRLLIRYEHGSIPHGASCVRRRLTRAVNAASDDAEDGASRATTGADTLAFDAAVGLRFDDMRIPRGASIAAAYLEFTAAAADSGPTSMAIRAESRSNVPTYSDSAGAVRDRVYSSAATGWSIAENWRRNGVYRSADISAQIAGIVGRADWTAGDALGLQLLRTGDNRRRAIAFDGNPAQAPRLVVAFTDDGRGLRGRKVRDVMKQLVGDLDHQGETPIQDTLYEAALYYAGRNADYGTTRGRAGVNGGPFSYARVSSTKALAPDTYALNRPPGCSEDNLDAEACRTERIDAVGAGPTYASPIDSACRRSHIVLLTDGQANVPHSAVQDAARFSANKIEPLMTRFAGGRPQVCLNEATVDADDPTRTTPLSDGEQCVKDLVRAMHNPAFDVQPAQPGNQNVTTHTIGFAFSSRWLEDVAGAGGGRYATVADAAELKDAVRTIIADVVKTDATFVAPALAVDEFNQLSHLNQVYFAVFRPDKRPAWRGNLKRYALRPGSADILDADGEPALDQGTGLFAEGARSFWSRREDGRAVDRGGAAQHIPSYTRRRVYTYYAGSTSTHLANSVNALERANKNLQAEYFAASSLPAAEFARLIDWIRGRDTQDENDNGDNNEDRYVYGDPLHSRPLAITYGGTRDSPDITVFFGTNAGAIHAVDADNGSERFAFFPQATLPIQNTLRRNVPGTPHPYGMDGSPTAWVNDNQRDGIKPADSEDFVRIYMGMRRGGRNYYALEVTDRDNPRILWQIEGNTRSARGDFRQLGQTWSRPVKTRIRLAGDSAPRDVLLFTAGYDPAQDDARLRTADRIGRGMYIVDALTGTLIWSGGKTGAQTWTESFAAMDYSFPSAVAALDINRDGLVDMWFVADTGGQLWRFDVRNGAAPGDLVSGGVIADLGVASGANSAARNRRFFAAPSVALVRGPGGPELAVAIGSGFRPSPLATLAVNRLFMIRQAAVFSPPSAYTALTEADLYDASRNTLADTTLSDRQRRAQYRRLAESRGWYFDFPSRAEKALSSPLIVNHRSSSRIVFATYTPGAAPGNECAPAAGASRAYSVRLEDAVRTAPVALLTSSIVDQAVIVVPPPDSGGSGDPNHPEPRDPQAPGSPCPNGNRIAIKLNAEEGPDNAWCNDALKTYWVKER